MVGMWITDWSFTTLLHPYGHGVHATCACAFAQLRCADGEDPQWRLHCYIQSYIQSLSPDCQDSRCVV